METVRKIIVWKGRFLLVWWPVLTLMWCVFWFIFIFSPLEQGDAYAKRISPTKFEYSNVSRKPFPSELICQIERSVLVVDSNLGEDIQVNQREDNWGTGNGDWKTWKVTGTVPFGATALVVHKQLTYRCLGVFFKKVYTSKRILDVPGS